MKVSIFLNLDDKIRKEYQLMDYEAAKALINLKAENKLLNTVLSREINFRYKDQSSIFKSSKS